MPRRARNLPFQLPFEARRLARPVKWSVTACSSQVSRYALKSRRVRARDSSRSRSVGSVKYPAGLPLLNPSAGLQPETRRLSAKYRNEPCPRVITNPASQFVTIYPGHHDVRNDEVGLERCNRCESPSSPSVAVRTSYPAMIRATSNSRSLSGSSSTTRTWNLSVILFI